MDQQYGHQPPRRISGRPWASSYFMAAGAEHLERRKHADGPAPPWMSAGGAGDPGWPRHSQTAPRPRASDRRAPTGCRAVVIAAPCHSALRSSRQPVTPDLALVEAEFMLPAPAAGQRPSEGRWWRPQKALRPRGEVKHPPSAHSLPWRPGQRGAAKAVSRKSHLGGDPLHRLRAGRSSPIQTPAGCPPLPSGKGGDPYQLGGEWSCGDSLVSHLSCSG